ncbi:MAG: hypothetical protein GXP51_11990 [Deltaproteobacteria bacterium]|nr:hypothetical protein [Deltaproteobacteria bacterium]
MLLIGLACLGVTSLVNFYFSIQVLRRVAAAEIKISFFEIRWQVHKYLKDYRRLTRQDGGRIGSAFYGYWLSLLLMLISVIVILASFQEPGLPL